MLLSIIVPVYNRPDEVRELLESLTRQTFLDYELIIVEDGSSLKSDEVVDSYRHLLGQIQYYYIENGGPSKARNYGAGFAKGRYLVILDSDVILPEHYLSAVAEGIKQCNPDCFGGPDAAHPSFNAMQHAVSYSMTSFWTTGGIRGGSADMMEKFKPRSFNLVCKREVFVDLNGFYEGLRYGEDMDFSLRLEEAGYQAYLFKNAYVYHKRRIDLRKFFRQVYYSGMARVELEKRHPHSTKLVHYLPTVFTIFSALSLLSVVASPLLMLYALILLFDALIRTERLDIAWRVIPTSFVQLWGYGCGFIAGKLEGTEAVKRH